MHTKSKGNIGEARATVELMRLGLPVFRELGDSAKIDLITIVDKRLITIQVKYCNEKK